MKSHLGFLCLAIVFGAMAPVLAQNPSASPPQAAGSTQQRADTSKTWANKPSDIAFKPVDFYSEGVRLSGQVIYAAANEGRKLPAVVSATGWGGQANSFRTPAAELARAGYAVFLFDYRGWGGSDGRLVLAQPPALSSTTAPGTEFTAPVRELRRYIDPWEQTTDWFNAIGYVAGQLWADAERIGIRGASFSGGHVIYVAAHDPRVKAVASLIGAFDGSPETWIVEEGSPQHVRKAREALETKLATGDVSAFPAAAQRTFSGLQGSVPGAKLSRWNVVNSAHLVNAPALFILAANEELFDNRNHGIRACEEVKGPRKMVLVPDAMHYDIYGIEAELATKATIDWFDRYLLPKGSPTRADREKVTLPTEPVRGSCTAIFTRTPGASRGPGEGAGYRGPPRPQ